MRLNERAQESAMSNKPIADGPGPDRRESDAALARALERARLAILWERLWPALAAPAGWGHRALLVLRAGARRPPAAPAAAAADPDGRVAASGWQVRPAASAGDHHRGRHRGHNRSDL